MRYRGVWRAKCLRTVSWPVPDHGLFCLLLESEDVPGGTDWLSPREAAVCSTFRFPKRRDDWLLGRWTAKQALLRLQQDELGDPTGWEILADESGAPVVHKEGRPGPLNLSLSHSNGRCLCTLSHAPLRLGCDLELVEARSSAFEETWFEQAEIELVGSFPGRWRPAAVTLVWSAKESVLKALRTGLSADTRRARIVQLGELAVDHWQPFRAIDTEDQTPFTGWWKEEAGMMMTVVADVPTREPVPL